MMEISIMFYFFFNPCLIFRIIMTKTEEADDKICFDEHPDANPESRKKSLKRFQMNPERNWGPKMRSKTSTLKQTENVKRIRNQGKNTKKPVSPSDPKKAKIDD